MNFNTLKSIFLVAIIATFTMACKDSNTKTQSVEEKAPVEQSTEAQNNAAATPANTSAEEVALNPPHGQPGHRCDIAVGQPLNSKAAPQNNANVNPPHGQPGHRCDIAVGQPLPQ